MKPKTKVKAKTKATTPITNFVLTKGENVDIPVEIKTNECDLCGRSNAKTAYINEDFASSGSSVWICFGCIKGLNNLIK